VVPILAVAEVFTGVYAVIDANTATAVALAAWYAGFTVFVAVALRRAVPLASCGCLGTPDTPPSPAHLVVDGVFALVAVLVAIDPYGTIDDLLADQPGGGVPLLLWVAIGVYATYLVLAVLPLTLERARPMARVRT
jgi:hypothetical protein